MGGRRAAKPGRVRARRADLDIVRLEANRYSLWQKRRSIAAYNLLQTIQILAAIRQRLRRLNGRAGRRRARLKACRRKYGPSMARR